MLEETIFKICSMCKRKKKYNEFTKQKRTKDGYRCTCKECIKKVKHIAISGSNKEKSLFNWAKKRAMMKNIEFTITQEDIVIPENCPVLGIPINRYSIGHERANSPSIDRIDNSKGYTKDNIRIISWRANHLKNSASINEIRMILAYMELKTFKKS